MAAVGAPPVQSQALIRAIETHAGGDIKGAVQALAAVLERPNGSLEELRFLARLALDDGDPALALRAAKQILRRRPEDGGALSVQARAASRLSLKSAPGARKHLERRAQSCAEAAFGRALLSLDVRAGEQAIPWLDLALRIDPSHITARSLRAGCLVRARRFDQARTDYDAVLERDPKQVRALLGRARLNSMVGDFPAAEADYRYILGVAEGYPPALAGLLGLHPKDATDLVELAKRKLAEPYLNDGNKIELGYALAKSYAKLHKPGRAWAAARVANGYQSVRNPFDEAALEAQLENDRKLLEVPHLKAKQSATPLPILVCGMPRSGTTLVESVLAQHSEVAAGGEIPFFRNASRWISEQGNAEEAICSRNSQLQKSYLDRLQKCSTGEIWVVDKMPENWRYLGLVNALLGPARIVWLVRDPRDIAVSIFFEHFALSESFTHDMHAIVQMIRKEREALSFWKSNAHHRICVVQYEQLVRHPEAQVGRLLDRLELGFEDACLQPHTASRPIDTPSRWQVRQRFNTQSVGRWRQYAEYAPETFEALGKIDDQS